jgi:hypothetical protein
MDFLFRERFPFSYVAEPDCGVSACCNSSYFPGLQLLWYSLQNQIPFTVFDNGLNKEELAWCKERMNVLTIEGVMPKNVQGWQAFDKPFYIAASPYRYTLWVDTDCIFVNSPKVIFDYIKNQLLITVHHNVLAGSGYPGHNNPKLYEMFPVKETYAGQTQGVNSGVIGLDLRRRLDLQFLGTWKRNTLIAATNPEILSWIAWWDEGVCHWAMAELGLYKYVVRDEKWNRFWVQRATNPTAHIEALLPEKDDVIMHCTGQPKYWLNWQ